MKDDDELWKLVNPCSEIATNITASWDDPYGGGGYGKSSWDREYSNPKAKRKHEFSPVLLINSTVYDCKHCGIKKEDAKSDYCDGTEDKDDDYDIGGWG